VALFVSYVGEKVKSCFSKGSVALLQNVHLNGVDTPLDNMVRVRNFVVDENPTLAGNYVPSKKLVGFMVY
jgi:hypothetical protein